MATPFAAIESAVNSGALGVLANATLSWGVSSTADGIFDSRSTTLLGDLVSGSDPVFTGLTSQIGGIAYGTDVTVASTSYTVARNEPDGLGVTRLTLQTA